VRTPVCELLGIEQPIVQAPIGPAAVPRLAAAVSDAGALGMLSLTWAADGAKGWEAGGHAWGTIATLPLVPAVVDAVAPVPVIAAGGIGDARGVAAVLALGAQAAWLGTRFLLAEEAPVHEDYRRRLIAAAETDAHWYADLYDVGWPDAPHRAIRNSTARGWEAAGRPAPGHRPGEGEAIARRGSEPVVRYSSALPLQGTEGDIEALSLWAGQGVTFAKRVQPAAEIIAELTSRL
jgi:nitronate monooxygenase